MDIPNEVKIGAQKALAWQRLSWFEPMRQQVARSISEKLGIPLSQFADSDETAQFHFMSLCIAIGNWIYRSRMEEMEMEEAGGSTGPIAREKIIAGILVRLFSQRYVHDIAAAPNIGQFLAAFSDAANVNANIVSHLISANSYVRNATLRNAQHLAHGSEVVTMEFFDSLTEFLDNDESRFLPIGAVIDAALQLHETLCVVKDTPNVPWRLPSLPAEDPQAHSYLRNYLMLAGMSRKPALLVGDDLTLENASLDEALNSLKDEPPKILMDCIFQQSDDSLAVGVPVTAFAGGDTTTYLLGMFGRHSHHGSQPMKISALAFRLI